MRNEYILLYNEQYILKLLTDIKEIDYYTNVIIELSTKDKNIIIFKDNLLFLKNTLAPYVNNIDNYILNEELNEKSLGLLLNEYYYELYENIENKNIVKNERDCWIGEKYCCFSTNQHAVWMYKIYEKIVLKVTPIFTKFDEDDFFDEYLNFIESYSDIFSGEITIKQIENIFKVVSELNEKIQF